LLTAGADPYPLTRRGWNALHYSMAGGHAEATRLLVYWDSDCGALGSQMNSAGALPVVEMLLEAGADPRASDIDGNTPAHFALAYANAEIAAALVKRGADLEACNKEGKNLQDVGGL
ncbi:unnamed protein product, partial [Laminaria digitata]